MSRERPRLPVDEALPAVLDALRRDGAVVVVAPPGAGKTTRVPPAVLDAGLAGAGKVVMLQPRRVAARASAARIAAERGVSLGAEVGYRVRFDDRTSATTRIEVLTEGLLTRRLQADPFLEDVGCVVLDELHERSLHADLALAMLAEVRQARDDLRLVVMSATLDPGPVADFLGCAVVEAAGRAYPVEVAYDPAPLDGRPAERAAAAALQALRDTADGHVLVFLPGVGEIERAAERLVGAPAQVLPLHGSLSADAQDRALAPSADRKIVLATNIAETSVTLEGVRVVVDTGLARVPRFDPAIGLTRLELGRISRASAEQRAGRAGRTGPGRCRRLWTEAEHRGLLDFEAPEIRRVDLSGAALEVLGWGAEPTTFGWFEAPPPAALAHADAVLRQVGARDDAGLTALGRTLLRLPLSPRLARVVVAGHAAGHQTAAATVAALAAERDLYRDPPDHVGDSDLTLRLDALAAHARGRTPPGVSRRAAAQVAKARDQLVRVAIGALGRPSADAPADEVTLARLLLAGFPDRVGRRRAPNGQRFRLASGAGARLDERSAVRHAELIVAVTLDGARRGERAEHRVRIATAIDAADLPTTTAVETRFDPEREAVTQVQVTRYLGLVLAEVPAGRAADAAQVARTLAEAVAVDPPRALALGADAAAFVDRLRWLAAADPTLDLPTLPELQPGAEVSPLLEALCHGHRSFAGLRRLDLLRWLQGWLGHAVVQTADRLAPTHLPLPDGTRGRLTYTPGEPPVLAAQLQRLFGLTETPRVAGGKAPVLLHLLAPNQRPTQITADLASFWANGYPEVRKQLRGRYPKHRWPEDPLTAEPGVRRSR